MVGILKAYEERVRKDEPAIDQGKLLLNNTTSSKRNIDANRGGRGRRRLG